MTAISSSITEDGQYLLPKQLLTATNEEKMKINGTIEWQASMPLLFTRLLTKPT